MVISPGKARQAVPPNKVNKSYTAAVGGLRQQAEARLAELERLKRLHDEVR